MGLGRILRTPTPAAAGPVHERAITEFAIIDGVRVDGSGVEGVRYRGGMSIPGAWRAANLLSDLLGALPWDAYRDKPSTDGLEKLTPTPVLLQQPAPPDTRMTTVSSLALDLIWHGNGIALIAGWDSYGTANAILPVPAQQVGVRRITDRNDPSVLAGLAYYGEVRYAIGGREYGTGEVLHVKGPCEPSALRGMGVLEYHLTGALGIAREQLRQAANLAEHGVPTGVIEVLSPDATQAELSATKSEWVSSQRNRTVAVLNTAVKFTPVSWSPEDLQLVEARRYTLTDLENIFGLPVGWLGGMTSARQYSNIEQDAVNLIKFTLGGHLARFEQTLSLLFPRGTEVRANLDALLRADTKTRYEAHEIALRNQFRTVDEIRDDEDLPPLPAGAFPVPVAPTAPPNLTAVPNDEENTDDQQAS